MTTYNTGNSIGSADPRDLYDNAQVIDDYANSDAATTTDRLGVERATIAGIDAAARAAIANAGYEFVGDYAAGIELTAYNQVVRDTSGEFWRVSGSTALPYTTTGAGMPEGGAFVTVGDAALRQELANGTANVSSSTGMQTVAGALDRRAVKFTALRPPDSGTFDPENYLETSTKVTEGLECVTLSYYAPNYASLLPFSGGNSYLIEAVDGQVDDYGAYILLSGSGLFARGLFPDGKVTIKRFGADATIDNTASIQSAINYVASFGDYQERVLYIDDGLFEFTALEVPESALGFNIRGNGYRSSMLMCVDETSTPAIHIKAQEARFIECSLEASINHLTPGGTEKVGLLFQKEVGSTADIDGKVANSRVSRFFRNVRCVGRGLEVSQNVFSIGYYCVSLDWPNLADYTEGSDEVQKDLTGFRAHKIINNRFHSIVFAAVENTGPNAHKLRGLQIIGAHLDIGRRVFHGHLGTGFQIADCISSQSPTEMFRLTGGSDGSIDNPVFTASTDDTRVPDNIIYAQGDYENVHINGGSLVGCNQHAIQFRDGVGSGVFVNGTAFRDVCREVGSFCPIAFVGAGHAGSVENIKLMTGLSLTGIVRTTDASANVQVISATRIGTQVPYAVGAGSRLATDRYSSKYLLSNNSEGIYGGVGNPEGLVTAPTGSVYLRFQSGGGAGTHLYVKESGTGNTGWIAK